MGASSKEIKWICSQFGAREKYAIPRALHLRHKLDVLFTDMWINPDQVVGKIYNKARGRFHSDLKDATVKHFNSRFLYLKFLEKISSKVQYDLDSRYDDLLSRSIARDHVDAKIFFGYSYSSRKSMAAAKTRGLRTVLGQINPGPVEADMVVEEYKNFHGGRYQPFVPDKHYWDLWREEVAAADKLIVNSEWSARLLHDAGISFEKMSIVPLAYEERVPRQDRTFPEKFETKRPLKLLYLGGLELRKGVHILIKCMRSLVGQPVHLDLVGSLKAPDILLHDLPANITCHGQVFPGDISRYYNDADLFVFPTLSDGFGLTLLEAQAHRLPVLCSTNCARVITHDRNGLVLDKVDEVSIVGSVQRVLDNPGLLPAFSNNAISMNTYSIESLASILESLDA